MHEKITAEQRKRLAVVYVRQSSPGQVRHHQESRRVQRGLQRRARALGWDASRIQVIENLGKSASRPGQRAGFDDLLQSVRAAGEPCSSCHTPADRASNRRLYPDHS